MGRWGSGKGVQQSARPTESNVRQSTSVHANSIIRSSMTWRGDERAHAGIRPTDTQRCVWHVAATGPLRPRPAWTRVQRARAMWQMTRAGGRVRHRSRGVRNELLVEQFAHGTAHVFPQLPGVGDLHNEGQAGAPVRQCTRACSALARPRNAATPRPPCPSAQAYHALLGDAMRRARNARHRPGTVRWALRETFPGKQVYT